MRAVLISNLIISLGFLSMVVSALGTGIHSSDNVDCLSCHDNHSEQFGHFIETSDDCVFCHELSSGESAMTSITDDEICRVCHVANSDSVEGGAHVSLSCMECHDAHSSPNPNLYRTLETSLCSNECHGDHDIGASHPVGETVADTRIGGAMSCVSTCHSMHEPQEPKMLQMAALDLCNECHSDKF